MIVAIIWLALMIQMWPLAILYFIFWAIWQVIKFSSQDRTKGE